MQELGVSNHPMFFVSPVSDVSVAYSNILAEWLSSVKQNKVYVPDEPFPHAMLVKNNKLKHFKHIYSEGFSTEFQEVCCLFYENLYSMKIYNYKEKTSFFFGFYNNPFILIE